MLDIVCIEHFENKKSCILKVESKKVDFPLSKQNKELIAQMEEKLYDLGGVGLAAPQVNVRKKIISIYIPEDTKLFRDDIITYEMHTILNASYEPVGDEKEEGFEGCYSVESKSGMVPRYKKIKVTYQDLKGNQHTSFEEGFYARVLQHEIDHIEGVLIIDRLTPDCIQGSIDEMLEYRVKNMSEEKKQKFEELLEKKKKK